MKAKNTRREPKDSCRLEQCWDRGIGCVSSVGLLLPTAQKSRDVYELFGAMCMYTFLNRIFEPLFADVED